MWEGRPIAFSVFDVLPHDCYGGRLNIRPQTFYATFTSSLIPTS